jgi:hypothetical protein
MKTSSVCVILAITLFMACGPASAKTEGGKPVQRVQRNINPAPLCYPGAPCPGGSWGFSMVREAFKDGGHPYPLCYPGVPCPGGSSGVATAKEAFKDGTQPMPLCYPGDPCPGAPHFLSKNRVEERPFRDAL